MRPSLNVVAQKLYDAGRSREPLDIATFKLQKSLKDSTNFDSIRTIVRQYRDSRFSGLESKARDLRDVLFPYYIGNKILDNVLPFDYDHNNELQYMIERVHDSVCRRDDQIKLQEYLPCSENNYYDRFCPSIFQALYLYHLYLENEVKLNVLFVPVSLSRIGNSYKKGIHILQNSTWNMFSDDKRWQFSGDIFEPDQLERTIHDNHMIFLIGADGEDDIDNFYDKIFSHGSSNWHWVNNPRMNHRPYEGFVFKILL